MALIKKIVFLFVLQLVGLNASGQEDYFLTPQDKAYLFHTIRKSPILEHNIGRYIEYTGDVIELPNGEINYDSIELLIINDPELLRIHSGQIRKAPKGILAEAANKQAVWELNKTLHAHRTDELAKQGIFYKYEQFEKHLIKNLPAAALLIYEEQTEVNPMIFPLYNPTLTFKDKVAMMEGFKGWNEHDIKQFFDAWSESINKWVEDRAYEIFRKLGGRADLFTNVLVAAGDGSSTSGLFEEREKDQRGRWNRGLPKAVGLFPYSAYLEPSDKENKEFEVLPKRNSIENFETSGKGKATNIHLDVWGYNIEKQTTVVIEKRGKAYPLFGSMDSRFLSPDSTYGGGTTYYELIRRLEKDIVDLEEKVSGEKGLDSRISHYEEKKEEKLLEIDETEKELFELRSNRITTDEKKYKTKSKRKKRKKRQDAVVRYHSQLKAINKKIAEYNEKRDKVLHEMNGLNQRHSKMLDLIGREWVPFKEEEGFFQFEDGASFDLMTQEFRFPPTREPEIFEIRLIAIPFSHLSYDVDEVMMHINITDAIPNYDAAIQLTLNDVFHSDSYRLNSKLLDASDSLSVIEFFESLVNKDLSFTVAAKGSGIGKWNGFQTVKDTAAVPMLSYPGRTKEEQQKSKNDTSFVRLRTTQIHITIHHEIVMSINSFTDPVNSNFESPNEKINKKAAEHNLSFNDLLSGYRTYAVLKALQHELNMLAANYLEREEAKKVMDRLNKVMDSATIQIGDLSLKIKDFE